MQLFKPIELLKRKSFVFLLCSFISVSSLAQITVSGKVTDQDGNGLPGISIVVRNSTFGGATDATGNYSFTSGLRSGDYFLDFSGIGFASKAVPLKVGSGSSYSINTQLNEDALGLDEIVVTGTSAGTTRKQLGSYISTIKGDQLTKGATGNVLAALQGKTAGAQIVQNSGDPAGGISVRLRGISSISSGSDPLYIVGHYRK